MDVAKDCLDPKSGKDATYRDPPPFEIEAQGHRFAFFPGGAERLEALCRLIEESRTSLDMCFYIYTPDNAGSRVRAALVAAVRRGVKATLIVDGFGAQVDKAYFAEFIAAGGEFHGFQAKWSRRYLIRNHQKIVIADGEVAMMGGFNVEDSYFEPPEANGWNDLGFTLRGEAVGRVAQWFAQLVTWISHPRSQFIAIRRMVRRWDGGDGPVRVLIGGPTKGLSTWARCAWIDLQASKRLDMMMAYFSPPFPALRRIAQMARRGEANLILAGKSDNAATIGASRALYGRLLKAGAKIYEFEPCKLHTKLIVLDDVVYIGSANLDMRSIYINLEIMLRIEDRALADRMREFIACHVPASLEVTPEVHAARKTLLTRLRWLASWFLVSVVDYTVSRKLNLGLG